MSHRPLSVFASLLVPIALAIGPSACTFSAPVAGDGPAPAAITVGFDGASTLADERSGEIEIGVVLSEPTDVPVTVGYEIAGGTATPVDDFNTGNSTVTISPGQTRGVFLLTITEDLTPEADETIELVLVAPSGARIGAASAHQVRINANVLPRVQFMMEASSADEPTDALLAIVLDKASGFDITATFAVAAGSTAAPGTDYDIAIGMVTFTVAEQQAGTLTKAIPLDVLDDALDEDPETVVVTLDAVTNAVLAATNQTWTHTIVDVDPEPDVAFTVAASPVAEGATTANLEVRLSVVSGRDVTVPFTLDAAGSSATAATDFAVATASPLTIPAGMLTANIAVTIVQDTVDEPDETVAITLGSATNAGEVAPLTHTLTITDDDLACFGTPNSASDVCFDAAPQGALTLPSAIDTTTSTLCQATQPVGWTAAQDAACVIARDSITVNSNVTVTGGRPLVLVATTSLSINAIIDAASHGGGTPSIGPAAPSLLCKPFPTPTENGGGAGGGAGGSFMTVAGNGGDGDGGNRTPGTAAAADAAAPAKLRAGCTGQRGGNAGGGQNGGDPGAGGGAVYLLSGNTITFSNTGGVNVSGAGAGGSDQGAGGSGGGSGGMLEIFATGALTVGNSTKLVANGGGGSSGGSNSQAGAAGQDPTPAAQSTPALGGSGGGGTGGDGFAGNTAATSGSNAGSNDGGGGGGGAGGFIRSNKSLGNADVSAGSVVITP